MPGKTSPVKRQKIMSYEITAEIETGNLIHRKFDTPEELIEFVNKTLRDPEKILEIISPKRGRRKIGEQVGLYETEDDDEEW